jgi:hypothetical protein
VRQTRPAGRRPALVTFAAILLLLLGSYELFLAISELFRNAFGMLPPLTGNDKIVWGAVDVIYTLVLFYAGFALLQGRAIGRVIALLVAVLSAFRWATYVPYVPWAAAIVVGMCIVIIYAVAESEDYFVHS